jgi:hypothetical protein
LKVEKEEYRQEVERMRRLVERLKRSQVAR